jgi:hypothetical protein
MPEPATARGFSDVPGPDDAANRVAPLPTVAGPVAQHALDLPRAYEATGGVIECSAFSALLRDAASQPVSMLARWIVERRVVSFNWRAATLLPAFQFDLATMRPREGLADVIRELPDEYDDSDLADWFARPNIWLAGRTPAAVFVHDLPGVLNAARTDRFVAGC